MNKYKGIKVVVNKGKSYEEIINTTYDTIEEFIAAESHSFYNSTFDKVSDEPELFLVDVKTSGGNLSKLYNIRDKWLRGIFDYREYLNKTEIKKYLDNSYCVAVKGIGEIENIEEL